MRNDPRTRIELFFSSGERLDRSGPCPDALKRTRAWPDFLRKRGRTQRQCSIKLLEWAGLREELGILAYRRACSDYVRADPTAESTSFFASESGLQLIWSANRSRRSDDFEFAGFAGGIVAVCHLDLFAPTSQIVQKFRVEIQKEKRWSRAPFGDRPAWTERRLFRDLLIYWLRKEGKWTVEEINEQIEFMRLPPLVSSKTADPKAAVRKIAYDVRRLILEARVLQFQFTLRRLIRDGA